MLPKISPSSIGSSLSSKIKDGGLAIAQTINPVGIASKGFDLVKNELSKELDDVDSLLGGFKSIMNDLKGNFVKAISQLKAKQEQGNDKLEKISSSSEKSEDSIKGVGSDISRMAEDLAVLVKITSDVWGVNKEQLDEQRKIVQIEEETLKTDRLRLQKERAKLRGEKIIKNPLAPDITKKTGFFANLLRTLGPMMMLLRPLLIAITALGALLTAGVVGGGLASVGALATGGILAGKKLFAKRAAKKAGTEVIKKTAGRKAGAMAARAAARVAGGALLYMGVEGAFKAAKNVQEAIKSDKKIEQIIAKGVEGFIVGSLNGAINIVSLVTGKQFKKLEDSADVAKLNSAMAEPLKKLMKATSPLAGGEAFKTFEKITSSISEFNTRQADKLSSWSKRQMEIIDQRTGTYQENIGLVADAFTSPFADISKSVSNTMSSVKNTIDESLLLMMTDTANTFALNSNRPDSVVFTKKQESGEISPSINTTSNKLASSVVFNQTKNNELESVGGKNNGSGANSIINQPISNTTNNTNVISGNLITRNPEYPGQPFGIKF